MGTKLFFDYNIEVEMLCVNKVVDKGNLYMDLYITVLEIYYELRLTPTLKMEQ